MATNNYNSANWLKLIKWLEIYIYKEKAGECGRI